MGCKMSQVWLKFRAEARMAFLAGVFLAGFLGDLGDLGDFARDAFCLGTSAPIQCARSSSRCATARRISRKDAKPQRATLRSFSPLCEKPALLVGLRRSLVHAQLTRIF